MPYPELERAERFNALLDLLRDIGFLGKVCFAGLLFWLSMKWFGEVMGNSSAALLLHGLALDAVTKFFSVFQVHP